LSGPISVTPVLVGRSIEPDYDEDNGYEGADEKFTREHHSEGDVIDELIAISELESNQVEQQ
jgi:hypothetical protein